MQLAKLNRGLGWLWLALTIAWGVYSMTNIEAWMQAENGEFVRSMHRHAHAMGSLGAMFNVLYGNRIADVDLDDRLRDGGSVLALVGMVAVTLVWPGMLVGVPGPVATATAAVLIAAAVVLGYGELTTE